MRTLGYRADLRAARRRLRELGPEVALTPDGTVQYATQGTGSDVLVVHGIMGGFDAGLRLARGLLPRGHRVIAPSRFGYLGTPMPAAPSVAAQADALAGTPGRPRRSALGAWPYSPRPPVERPRSSSLSATLNGSARSSWVSSVAPGPYRAVVPRPVAHAV